MNADAALAFVERHGIVLVSAKGPAPRLTEVPAETLAAAQRLPAQEAETLLKGFIGSSPNRDIG